ncbi:MAG: hypothetical protein ACTHMI_22250 [Mucilaginibacter sp.]
MKQSCLLLLLFTLLLGCNKKPPVQRKVISLENLKKAMLDNNGNYTEVKILKTYPIQSEDLNERVANLYICRNAITSNDTIYVFDESDKVPPFARDPGGDAGISIDKTKVKINYPNKITVFVPKEFTMPPGAKYIFANLTALTE